MKFAEHMNSTAIAVCVCRYSELSFGDNFE